MQALAAGILILSGVQVAVFDQQWLNVVVTVIWVVGITNALNFLDNMDGLSAGVAAVASAFFLLLAALNNQYLVGVLSAALLGACIGFLFYNFNPASIFMGDSGSLFIGFVLAALGIKLRFPGQHRHRDLDGAGAGAGPAHLGHHPGDDLAAAARQEPADHRRQGPHLASPGPPDRLEAGGGSDLLPDRRRLRHGGHLRDYGHRGRRLSRRRRSSDWPAWPRSGGWSSGWGMSSRLQGAGAVADRSRSHEIRWQAADPIRGFLLIRGSQVADGRQYARDD